MTDYQRLRLECALDALYLIGNELQYADSDYTEEAGNAIFLLHGIMRSCISDERTNEVTEGTESIGYEASRDCLRRIRKERGMSQEALAKQLDVKQNTVSQWETGARNPSLPMLLRITEILECSMNDLVKG